MSDVFIEIEQINELKVVIESPELTFEVDGVPFNELPTHTHNIDDITATVLQLNEFNNTLYS